MAIKRQIEIAATFMRGGTSKGVFFNTHAVPPALWIDERLRDQWLLRVLGSPDPYAKQTDGMGGATSSTSKVVLVSKSSRADCDLDYLFGAVSIEQPVIDWSGNCGNLSAAVAPFGIAQALVDAPRDGTATVRIWQANIGKRIIAHVPMQNGEVVETGDFELDGVPFSGAAIRLEFLDPAGEEGDAAGSLFPTGQLSELLEVPGFPPIEVSLVNAGNPTVFVRASDLDLTGREAQRDVNDDQALLNRLEVFRAHAAVRMGLASTAEEATAKRPATPKLLWVGPPAPYTAAGGKRVEVGHIDLVARILSMGKLHHAMTGTGAVAIAVAASVPGTVVSRIVPGGRNDAVRFGHASGVLEVGAKALRECDGSWRVAKVVMNRSARRLMVGVVCIPAEYAPLV